MAFLLFTSPSTPNQQSDEEKLKTTYFARNGKITVTPKGKAIGLDINYQGKMVPFRVQNYLIEIDTPLSTPFSPQEGTLKGTIQIPIYCPDGPAGKEITKSIAAQSFNTTSPVKIPAELFPPDRDVSSKKTKKH
jgi:hypothetical protein